MRILALIVVVLGLLAGAVAWSVWRADTAPVTTPPNAQQQGAEKLHQQLVETKQHEAEVEKNVWGSTDQLVKLIHWHEDRIEKLKANSQASEIVAYDTDSIARIQTRINQLAAEEKARELAAIEKAKVEAAAAKAEAASGAGLVAKPEK
jgi:membrane protein involved in colicin uptake